MFKWLTKQSVEHSDGFVVKSAGRFEMAYVEQGKRMTIEVEDGRMPGGQFCVTIKPGAFMHWDGEQVLLPTPEQERIGKNFEAALKFQGIELVRANPDDYIGG